jgi:isoaspartyl peptidase/L-asparaginase-like protein (Ntn-hydrolase superfamily)
MAFHDPVIISTWNFGAKANQKGWEILSHEGAALDAVQQAAMVAESDPSVTSVGYGGYPNNQGVVQLDAALIDGKTGRMGSVGALEGIKNPIAVARKVLEANRHIYLMGDGAQRFAIQNGFELENLHTPQSTKWYADQIGKPEEPLGHDTIGVLGQDIRGDLAVGCTTSGLAMKWPGRVGDSPMIGAGLYLEQEVGGAVGTGVGERAIEVCGAFAIVEIMRNGASPQEACQELIRRLVKRNQPDADFQLAFIALNPKGEVGAACMKPGFEYAITREGENQLVSGAVYGTDFE